MMRIATYLLLFFLYKSEAFLKVSKIGFEVPSVSILRIYQLHSKINYRIRDNSALIVPKSESPGVCASTRLKLVDVDSLSTVEQQVSQTATETFGITMSTFFTSVSSRLVGILIGNILAAAFVKYVTDFFKNGVTNSKNDRAKENLRSTKKTTTADIESAVTVGEGYAQLPPDALFKLALCLAIDLLGDSSFLLPGVGEIEDIAWAPLSAYALKAMFGSNALAGLDFLKEILPGTDIVPLATIAWVLTYIVPQNAISSALGLGNNQFLEAKAPERCKNINSTDRRTGSNNNDENVIDV